MVLHIVKYGTPVLRQKGSRVEVITPGIQQLIADMFETMYAFKGVGLAAQQVGRPLQLTVVDVRGVTDRPSSFEIEGKAVEVNDVMPLVLINPEVKTHGEPVTGPEGCLSFPEIYADVERPALLEVKAMNEKGAVVQFQCGGLLSRAVQHEVDHLNGILFIDRMTRKVKESIRDEIEALQSETKALLKK
jgi:peptide deformylase